MRRILLTTVMVLCLTIQAYALIDIPWETITGHRESGIYSWNYAYDIAYHEEAVHVKLKLYKVGAYVGYDKWMEWDSTIENTWATDRFDVPITYNVDWGHEDAHYKINVYEGDGRTNMLNWYAEDSGATAAHEYGHMLGLYDEYYNPLGGLDPETEYINTGGLMHRLDGPTLDYYYDEPLAWYNGKLAMYSAPTDDGFDPNSMYVNGGDGTYRGAQPVPEPGSLVIFAIGIAGMWVGRKRKWRGAN